MSDPKTPDQDNPGSDWADAMAEQDAGTGDNSDPWAEALAEQSAVEQSGSGTQGQSATDRNDGNGNGARRVGEEIFRPLEQGAENQVSRDLEMIMDIPVRFSVELGRTRITIKQLLELTQGSVVELDGLAGEPMDILINGYLIAQGEVVVVDDRYGIRITEIVTPSERVQKLNR